MEACDLATEAGLKVKLLIPKLIYPIAESVFNDFFKTVKKGLVVEQNYLGQLYHLMRMFVNVPEAVKPFAKAGSNPFGAREIAEKLKAL
jgi:2-oxoglutarate ferredoxin oxidoreductase subunit alpha